jgi:hypothetical protein
MLLQMKQEERWNGTETHLIRHCRLNNLVFYIGT